MSAIKLLIVEDDNDELDGYKASIRRYCEQHGQKIEVIGTKSLSETFNILDGSFDGVIIDIRIDDHGIEGLFFDNNGITGMIYQGDRIVRFPESDDSIASLTSESKNKFLVRLAEKVIEVDKSDSDLIYDKETTGMGTVGLKLTNTKMEYLNIAFKTNAGAFLCKHIHNSFRIPVAVLTGTPSNAPDNIKYVGVYTKGEVNVFDSMMKDLLDIYNTGLTKIIGGRGTLEKAMDKVFWENIYPQINAWKAYVTSGKQTEKALLRFTINHLMEFLDDKSESCFPEEMYITPPVSNRLKTGSIVKKPDQGEYYIILSPACDLVFHNSIIKTNRILGCFIESFNCSLIKTARRNLNIEIIGSDGEEIKSKKKIKIEKAKNILTKIPRNNFSDYYHFLPGTAAFRGGIIDFRKVTSIKPSDFNSQFGAPQLQISASFIKDIVARFSSYYARQGQPDFDFIALTEKLKSE